MSLESLNPSLGYGGAFLNTKLPKVLAELQGLTISGPLAGAGANAAIAVADGIDSQDTVVKALIQNGTTALLTDDTANVTIVDRRATGTITLSGMVAGDKVTVNGKTYTCVVFVSTPTNSAIGPYNFSLGATDAATAANLATAIMSADSSLTAAVLSGAVVTLFNRVLGTVGNSVTLDVSLSNAHATKSGTTLTGGTATTAIKTTTNTTSNFVILVWYKKSRVVGQF